MNLDRFLEQRRPSWTQLEKLLLKAKDNVRDLSKNELDELGLLYRTATSDLALAQRDFSKQKVAVYLNQLVGQTHALIYQERPVQLAWFRRFFTITFPQLYRELLPYTILATLLFLIPALLSYYVVLTQPEAAYMIQGEGLRAMEREVASGKLWTEIAPSVRSTASAGIMTNNIQVTFLAFAGGMLSGLLTVYIMITNGMHLGSIFAWLQPFGLSGGLAEFVVAHGFIELSVIFLAGGCGLYLGDGILRPGLLSRRQALIERGRAAVLLILGCVPLLITAGLIEGFISPSSLPWMVKLAVGLSTGIALHSYWLLAGKQTVTNEAI